MKDKDTQPPQKTESTKTPQWMRDVAVGAKTKNETPSSKDSPPLVSTDQYSPQKQRSNNQKSSLASADPNFNPNDKIKKTHQKLLEIEELKRKDKKNEIIAEQKVEAEDKRIEELLNNHFNN